MRSLGKYRFMGGYDSSQPELVSQDLDILAPGSANLLYIGQGRLEAFKGLTITNPVTGGRTTFNFSDGYASLNDYDPGSGNIEGRGSIFISFAKSLWFVGAGKVWRNGVDLSATATTTLSFRKLAAGVYTGTTYPAGLDQPSAPAVAARTGGFGLGLTGLLNGTYAVKLTKIRSTSGGESIASLPSAVISVANGTIRITFSSVGSSGEDRHGVYSTQAGFGFSGPFLLLREVLETEIERSHTDYVVNNGSPIVTSATAAFTAIDATKHFTLAGGSTVPAGTTVLSYDSPTQITLSANVTTTGSGRTGTLTSYVDGIDRAMEFEWRDGGLLPILAPTDNYRPPLMTHAVQLEDITVGLGCYGDSTNGITSTAPGNGMAYSLAGFPEAWPPDNLLFLPEAPIHVLMRPSDRFAYVLMKNSIGVITYTGGQPGISFEIIWDNIGCSAPHQAVIVEGRLYVIAGGKLVRVGAAGEPEDRWSNPLGEVRNISAANLPAVVLGYDAKLKQLAVCYSTSIYSFNTAEEKWGAPCNVAPHLTGDPLSTVTVNNRLLITYKNGSTFNSYFFNEGLGSTWQAHTNWSDAGNSLRKKIIYLAGMSFRRDTGAFSNLLKIFRNTASGKLDGVTAAKTVTYTNNVDGAGSFTPRPARVMVRSARVFKASLTGTSGGGADSGPIALELEGEDQETV